MSIRLTTQLSIAALALAFAAGTPAVAQTTATAPAHHHHPRGVGPAGVGHVPAATSGEAAVDDLNKQSLTAAQAGQNFTPAPPAAAPAAPAKTSHKKAM